MQPMLKLNNFVWMIANFVYSTAQHWSVFAALQQKWRFMFKVVMLSFSLFEVLTTAFLMNVIG